MNSDITNPVKAQSTQNLQSSAVSGPKLALEQPRNQQKQLSKIQTIDDNTAYDPRPDRHHA